MRYLLFLLCIMIIGCGNDKPSASGHQATDRDGLAKADSVQGAKATVDFVTGQFDFHKRDEFIKVPKKYSNKEVYLQKSTYQAFRAMLDSARKDGINFVIVSGTRNFYYQKSIWDRKWKNSDASSDMAKAKEILLYSSMPMTSRHHWGTDMDLNHLSNDWFEKGQGKKEYEWLEAHANDFGFYQPYTDKSLHGRTGYEEEKWHWSYMPLAVKYLAFYNKHVTNKDITGFKGSSLASKIDMVGKYVNGVSQKIKNYGK